MKPVPLIRASVLEHVFATLERLGVACGDAVAVARSRLADPLAVLPLAMAGMLFSEAARASGLDDLGLRAGAASQAEDIGALGALVRRAPTVCAAIDRAVRNCARFNSGERYASTSHGRDVWLHHRFSPVLQDGRRQLSEFVLMLWLGLIRVAAGADWRPTEIHFEGPPPRHAQALAALAREGVRFERSELVIVLPRSVLSLPLPALPPERTTALAAGVAAPDAWPHPEFVDSARQAIAALVRLGSPHIDAFAQAAGTSVRSLQRHLADAHLSFVQLLEEARCDAAQRMLRDPSTKVIAISTALGYSDSANFTRAFRRWTGLSPRAFRRSVVGRELAHQVGDLRPGVQAGLVERGA